MRVFNRSLWSRLVIVVAICLSSSVSFADDDLKTLAGKQKRVDELSMIAFFDDWKWESDDWNRILHTLQNGGNTLFPVRAEIIKKWMSKQGIRMSLTADGELIITLEEIAIYALSTQKKWPEEFAGPVLKAIQDLPCKFDRESLKVINILTATRNREFSQVPQFIVDLFKEHSIYTDEIKPIASWFRSHKHLIADPWSLKLAASILTYPSWISIGFHKSESWVSDHIEIAEIFSQAFSNQEEFRATRVLPQTMGKMYYTLLDEMLEHILQSTFVSDNIESAIQTARAMNSAQWPASANKAVLTILKNISKGTYKGSLQTLMWQLCATITNKPGMLGAEGILELKNIIKNHPTMTVRSVAITTFIMEDAEAAWKFLRPYALEGIFLDQKEAVKIILMQKTLEKQDISILARYVKSIKPEDSLYKEIMMALRNPKRIVLKVASHLDLLPSMCSIYMENRFLKKQ